MDEEIIDTIWMYLRDEMTDGDFEAWVYEVREALVPVLGQAFYEHVLFLDFRDRDALHQMTERLRETMERRLGCICRTLRARDFFYWGYPYTQARFARDVHEITRGRPGLWWLWLGRCAHCGQHWMVAQEERVFDVFIVDRVSEEVAEEIVAEGQWPADFLTYEKVLTLGRTLCRSRLALRPDAGLTKYTVHELKAERPDINSAEIGVLLGMSAADVESVLEEEEHKPV